MLLSGHRPCDTCPSTQEVNIGTSNPTQNSTPNEPTTPQTQQPLPPTHHATAPTASIAHTTPSPPQYNTPPPQQHPHIPYAGTLTSKSKKNKCNQITKEHNSQCRTLQTTAPPRTHHTARTLKTQTPSDNPHSTDCTAALRASYDSSAKPVNNRRRR